MQVQISGQHISTGESLNGYVEQRTVEVVTKYFSEAPSAHVHFSRRGNDYICDIVVNEGTGRHVIIKSRAICDDIYSAYDQSIGKLEKQLRKYKSKLNDHSKKLKISEIGNEAIKYVISTSSFSDSEMDQEQDKETDVDNPVIIAEAPSKILSLSVGEAVMQMDLQNLPALMFKNVKNERINIVYYRKDGNISWVDSK